jgi:hypothetical protein
LKVPLTNAVALLTDDRKGYVPLPALELAAQGAEAPATPIKKALFTKGTVNAYIAAVLELWQVQVAHGNGNIKNPCGIAVRGFLKQRSRQQGKLDHETYKNRDGDGIQAGYSIDK